MFLIRRIEAYKKENRRAISLQGIDSCPVSISHDGVMKVIWRCYESVMEPFCPFLKNFRCYESHMKVLRKCYRNYSHQLTPNARVSSYSSVVRCSFAAANSLVASSFIPCAFRERISQQYAFGLSGAMVRDFMAYWLSRSYGESQCCAGINHATARAEQSYIVVWLGGSSKNESHFVKNQPENY